MILLCTRPSVDVCRLCLVLFTESISTQREVLNVVSHLLNSLSTICSLNCEGHMACESSVTCSFHEGPGYNLIYEARLVSVQASIHEHIGQRTCCIPLE